MLSAVQEKQAKELMLELLNTTDLNLSQIQQRVNEKLGVKMTYMEVRILASELEGVDWGGPKPEEKPQQEAEGAENLEEAEVEAEPAPVAGEVPEKKPAGKAVVGINKIARPGVLYSGDVTFPNGSTAEWYLDQMGRLGLDKLVGAKPGPEDVEAFQIELQNVLEKAMGR